jgi:hypothetical protein
VSPQSRKTVKSRAERPENDDEVGVSGFGGHPLTTLSVALGAPDDQDGTMGGLSAIGVEDAEQIVAAAAVPGASEEIGVPPLRWTQSG